MERVLSILCDFGLKKRRFNPQQTEDLMGDMQEHPCAQGGFQCETVMILKETSYLHAER